MKKQLRTAMLSTACMLIVAVMSLTGVTYAWFTQGDFATVKGISMEVTAAEGGVLISKMTTDGTWANYASTVDLEVSRKSVSPVSSTDGREFYTLSVNSANDQQVKPVEYAATGNNVITQRLKMKNPGAEDITIVLDSENSWIDNSDTAINDAVRVALIVTDQAGTANTTVYIWAPNDEDYVGITSTSTDWVTIDAGIIPATAACAETVTITSADKCEIDLAGIDADTGAETEVYVTLVVWLEGQDSDCVNKNAGASFDVQLQFIDSKSTVTE